MKKWIKNFLKKLEKANKKSLGSERLDCCKLNSDSKPGKQKDDE